MAFEIFDTARRAGYQSVIVLQVDGIPWLLPEMIPKRATGAGSPALPSGYEGACGCLYLDERQALSQELDRETGVARGDAVSLTLTWEALEAAGLNQTLFRRPSKRARLAASVAPTDTTLTLDDANGWVGGDLFFLGRECGRVGGTSGATLTGCTRGIAGKADRYSTASPSSFADVTDRPQIWRGRRVRLYEHLLSPEGRFLQTSWLESGGLTRLRWQGYIDDEPRPTEVGMTLRALPLQRLAAEEIGYEIAMKVVRPAPEFSSWAGFPIVASEGSQLIVRGRYTGPGSGSFEVTIGTYTSETPTTLGAWMSNLTFDLDAQLVGQPWYSAGATVNRYGAGTQGSFGDRGDFISVTIPYDTAYTMTALACVVLPVPQLYWLRPGVFEGFAAIAGGSQMIHFDDKLRLTLSTSPGAWLVVEQTEGEGWQDLAIPSTGAAILEDADRTELIRWDRTQSASWVDPRWVLLHVIERGAGGTAIIDLDGLEEVELKFASGHLGTAAEVLLTLLQSSGAGNRGTYDTLGLGVGLGIEEAAIDVATIAADPDLAVLPIAAFAAGRTSIEELLGGWLALHGKCLTMRQVVTLGEDVCKLTIVSMLPIAYGPRTPSLERADVELEGVDYPEAITPPNEVRVSLDSIQSEGTAVIVQDRVAIQASGPRTFETSAPGMTTTLALQLGANLIAAGLGQVLWSAMVTPGIRLWPGDTCVVRVAHPGLYNWGTGERAPAAMAAVVVGDSEQPWGGRRRLTLLLAGVLAEGNLLAPCLRVEAVGGNQLEFYQLLNLTSIGASNETIRVRLYNPGEPSENDTFDGVVAGEDIFTLSAAPPAWVNDTTTILTMGDLGTGDAEFEGLYFYQASSKRWSP